MPEATGPLDRPGDDFPDETDDPDTSEGAPAADGSQLQGLRARRAKAKEALFHDIKVPRLDPPVYVRFKPVSQARVDKANKQARISRDEHATVIANATILADACIGVFEIIDDQKVSVDPDDRDGPWPRFGPRLAELIGAGAKKSAQVVRDPHQDTGLYLTDGDVIATCLDLSEWSGFAEQQELDEGN